MSVLTVGSARVVSDLPFVSDDTVYLFLPLAHSGVPSVTVV